jgi:photosystem II stability/assembly factor-like uncharacterized protein
LVAGLLPAITLAQPESSHDASFLQSLQFRSIGPYRGGRATAVAGVPSEVNTFYMGSTGGGVWKTTDGGQVWTNLSDKFFKSASIGAIAVADSDPNVIYVGTGSACPRGNISAGDGVYKSTDAGKTWKHAGLPDAGQIGRIRVHPGNPDLVYVAALGHIFGPNPERGVYRSKDGGASWERVHFISNDVGAVDLAMDARNPRILYAAFWRAERKPFTMVSGSEDGGLFRTADGGDTWTKLEKGLPEGLKGKIGVTVSPANPDRVWALIEAPEGKGGVYRSDDGGESFKQINKDRNFLQRAWYYTHIFADSVDPNTVYVLNVLMYRSVDGGVAYTPLRVPHGDTHNLWINPHDNDVMIYSDDGGAAISYNGGKSWSSQGNQPTGEFYRVTTDHRWPYWVYGSQQDNTTVRIASRTGGFGITEKDWHDVGGCESGHIAIDPRDPNASVVYAGCYGGSITRYDHRSGQQREITTHPQLALGQAPKDLRYRFQWNAPIRISPHDPKVLYHTSNYVHLSEDEGQSWRLASPDLTRDNKEMQEFGGAPITRDNTGVEVFGTVFAFEESAREPGLLWAGSDDGRVHLSRDRGATWQEVTPKGIPEFATVNSIDPSAHDPARAHVAVYKYRFDDFTPYVFQTTDYGKSWVRIADGKNGIPPKHFVRVVREDPNRRGLLYAGTEYGIYVSFNDGRAWQPLQLNLPVTPVTDLMVKDRDLVLSTQGRGFWILDDLTPLYELTEEVKGKESHLFTPRGAARMEGGGFSIPVPTMGQNPPRGAVIHYYLKDEPKDEIKLEILDGSGGVIRALSSKTPEEKAPDLFAAFFGGAADAGLLPAKKGANRWVWDLRYPDAKVAKGSIFWGSAAGPEAVPGSYQVRLTVAGRSETRSFEVKGDPRLAATADDYRKQFDLAMAVRDAISGTYDAVKRIRSVRDQVNGVVARLKEAGSGDGAEGQAKPLVEKLTAIEEKLYQTKNEGMQDPLNFQPMLDNQLVGLYNVITSADARPTDGSYERFEELEKELEAHRSELDRVLETELSSFNSFVAGKSVGAVIVPKPE